MESLGSDFQLGESALETDREKLKQEVSVSHDESPLDFVSLGMLIIGNCSDTFALAWLILQTMSIKLVKLHCQINLGVLELMQRWVPGFSVLVIPAVEPSGHKKLASLFMQAQTFLKQ